MVTFLFTDIVSSTVLWEAHPMEMAAALTLHDELLDQAAVDHHGYVFKRVSDAYREEMGTPTEEGLARYEFGCHLTAVQGSKSG